MLQAVIHKLSTWGKMLVVVLIYTECAHIPCLGVFNRCMLSNNANLFVTFDIDMQEFSIIALL